VTRRIFFCSGFSLLSCLLFPPPVLPLLAFFGLEGTPRFLRSRLPPLPVSPASPSAFVYPYFPICLLCPTPSTKVALCPENRMQPVACHSTNFDTLPKVPSFLQPIIASAREKHHFISSRLCTDSCRPVCGSGKFAPFQAIVILFRKSSIRFVFPLRTWGFGFLFRSPRRFACEKVLTSCLCSVFSRRPTTLIFFSCLIHSFCCLSLH